MSATFAIITCHRSLSQFSQVRQFSILRRSTQLFVRLPKISEFKFFHSEHLRVRLPRNERLKQKLEDEKNENIPSGLFQKLKYYLKRYWYIAIPVHYVLFACWFGVFYLAVHFGLNVVGLLEFFHLPENWIQKVREMPKAASTLTATFILIKIFTPIRYASTIIGTNLTYKALKHLGWLRTVRQLEYRGRIEFEKLMRKMNERRIAAAAKYRKKNGNGKGLNGDNKKEQN